LAKIPRLTSEEAEKILFQHGFRLIRTKGSHRIYMKENKRIVVPFHKGKILHPKIVKQILRNLQN